MKPVVSNDTIHRRLVLALGLPPMGRFWSEAHFKVWPVVLLFQEGKISPGEAIEQARAAIAGAKTNGFPARMRDPARNA